MSLSVANTRLKALPHVTISSTMVFNVAKIASARASSTISLTKSLRVAGPLPEAELGQSYRHLRRLNWLTNRRNRNNC